MENQIQKFKKENNKLASKKLESQLKLLLHGQEINREEFRSGFRQLADQNRFLSLQNQKLMDLNQELKQQFREKFFYESFYDDHQELNQIEQERQEKTARKEAWAKRKRLPKRDPVSPQIYQVLIDATETGLIRYTAARLRVALCLLAITGIRVNELLPLKVHQYNKKKKAN